MNRRELLKFIAAATGTAMIGGSTLLAGCARNGSVPNSTFSAQDILLLDEVAETIVPRTDTPGAKDAEVGAVMTVMENDVYRHEEQTMFHQCLSQIDEAIQAEFGIVLLQLSQEHRHALVSQLDKEALAYSQQQGDSQYFTMIKQLTLFGFFTSKVGANEVLRYVAIPGRDDGCAPYKKGDRAWATQ